MEIFSESISENLFFTAYRLHSTPRRKDTITGRPAGA